MENFRRIALVGNPNVGKTSLFNKLCGLNQKTGNYPGVTIDKKRGQLQLADHKIEIIDLPGINSLYPNSGDEELVVNYLLNNSSEDFPDTIVMVVSALNLKRNLYLFDQLSDLGIPLILAINMTDLAEKRGIAIDAHLLSAELGVPVIKISARSEQGIDKLKQLLLPEAASVNKTIHYAEEDNRDLIHQFSKIIHCKNEYRAFLFLTQEFHFTTPELRRQRIDFINANEIDIRKWKVNESILRYRYLSAIVKRAVVIEKQNARDFTTKADKVLLHPVWGYAFFLLILFSIFQSVFWLAAYPMDWIDSAFSWFSGLVNDWMPEGYFSRLVTEGLIPGIGGVVIFVPQIAILFLLFSVLEESGYMPRIVYLMDRLMQRFGMSGKSIVPLISGFACAVPAIMSARTIENKKERLITILVTPLLTCSARIPVYVVVIALIVPDEMMGVFNARGIALMALYLLGALMAMIAAWVFHKLLKNEFKSYLILEMPEYLVPGLRNILISVWTSVRAFLWNAGKIIVATSIILFVLATNGLDDFKNAEKQVTETYTQLPADELQVLIAARQLETSFLGMIGRSIEPAIRPLGYDWKIGIAILSSLSAREVFVGTISTIYSIGSEEELKITDRLRQEKNSNTGLPVFTVATCVSLLLFYAFSLQCLSTVAVTYKETQSLRWTLIQFFYMTALAYFAALIAYQILS
ncbi:MAG: ferrous iron transport protein B [Bacteroidetes bacterium]|nr:ferrous iron transport protein B [Bacteroidota bacterium]